jgi:hypothetical protein
MSGTLSREKPEAEEENEKAVKNNPRGRKQRVTYFRPPDLFLNGGDDET